MSTAIIGEDSFSMANIEEDEDCPASPRGQDFNDKRHIDIVRTSIRHSDDEGNRHLYENLEMRRLGLPTRFTNPKIQRNYQKSKKRRWHQQQARQRERVFYSRSNQFQVTPMVTDEDKPEAIEEKMNEMVEEFPSMVLADNQFDCYEDLKLEEETENHLKLDNNNASTMAYSTSEDENEDPKKNEEDCFLVVGQEKKKNGRPNNYWRQRFILFSRYNRGIKLDNQSWYSVTPEPIAHHIAQRVQNVMASRYPPGYQFIVMDPFCGPGGNVIQFALQPSIKLVYAIDIDPKKIAMARHNARIYECEHKIEFIVGDFFQVTKDHRFREVVDVCFYSSPWGGPDYRKIKKFSLNHMKPNGFEIIHHASKYLTKNVVMLLPRNFDEQELEIISKTIYSIDPDGPYSQKVELEQNLVFNKVKTLTAYFGETINDDSIPNISDYS